MSQSFTLRVGFSTLSHTQLDNNFSALSTTSAVRFEALGVGVAEGVSGTITASGNITASSDERLKENWKDLPEDFIKQLSTAKIGTYDRIDLDVRQVGVSAQSLQKIVPEAVISTDGDDGNPILSVAYGNIALVSCVLLAREITKLNNVISDLRNEITELKK